MSQLTDLLHKFADRFTFHSESQADEAHSAIEDIEGEIKDLASTVVGAVKEDLDMVKSEVSDLKSKFSTFASGQQSAADVANQRQATPVLPAPSTPDAE